MSHAPIISAPGPPRSHFGSVSIESLFITRKTSHSFADTMLYSGNADLELVSKEEGN